MKRTRALHHAAALALAAGVLSAAGPATAAVAPATANSTKTASADPACASPSTPTIPGAKVLSITATYEAAGTDVYDGQSIPDVPGRCAVDVQLTHPGANDDVSIVVWLPDSWNGRYEGTGGGGYSAGTFDPALAPAIEGGYAAASTDAGVSNNALSPASWALNANGSLNKGLLTDFAYRSQHDMAVAAKQVIADYYGRSPSYSYWNGCSTGGRQGLMEAQRYPKDYNGIVADAPAINWSQFIPSELWPQVVMNQLGDFPTSCEFDAFTNAAVAACDKSDPVNGGIIDDPASCTFDPRSLIGTKVTCNGELLTITATDAEVVREIWQGPKTNGTRGRQLWYGLEPGASFDGLAGTATVDGVSQGSPFPISQTWIQYFLKQDPTFDTSTITYREFDRLFAQSVAEYTSIIGTENPDLSAFEKAGGKMVTFHGLADLLIFPQGTVDYYQRVAQATGGPRNVDSFYRLFLAPGVSHCGGGNGPVPTDPLSSVVDWVEHGQAPATLPAATTTSTGTTVTRDLCAYPESATYLGTGDRDSAASYRCTEGVHSTKS